jgi:membrane associated rhomboid family serine protease
LVAGRSIDAAGRWLAKLARTCYEGCVTSPEDDSGRFGSVAFYAAIGKAFVSLCAFIPVLFAIELIDRATGHRLDSTGGIRPHHISGLDGIVFAPFLHAGFPHLYANSVPLILTGTFVLATGVKRFLGVTVFIAVVSGLGVWLTGDPNKVVIGASGVIFGYLGFLLVRGIVERSWWGIGVGLLIALLYGTQISGVLPTEGPISWQAHLFGFIGGIAAAILFRRRRARADVSGGAGPGGGLGATGGLGTTGGLGPTSGTGPTGGSGIDPTLGLPTLDLPPTSPAP